MNNRTEAQEYINQAKALLNVEKNEDAIKYLLKVIEIDRMNEEAHLLLGIAYAGMDNLDKAEECFRNVLKINKGNGEALFHLGNIEMMRGRKEKGIQLYNEAIAKGYSEAQIYFNLGLSFEEEKDYNLAMRNYTKCYITDFRRTDARLRKANLYIETGKLEEALEVLDEVILADPEVFEGYQMKAGVLNDLGRYSEAIELLDKGAVMFPKDPGFYTEKVSIYVAVGKTENAEKLIDEIREKYELSSVQERKLALEKARICTLKNDMTGTVNNLKEAKVHGNAALETDDTEVAFLLANCYLETENYADAIKMTEELLESEDLAFKIPAYYYLPLEYSRMGEDEKAKELYNESVSQLRKITLKHPEILDAYFFRAMCLKDLKEYDKAIELCDYLIAVSETNPNEAFSKLKETIEEAKR